MQGSDNIIVYNTRIYEEQDLSAQDFYQRIQRVKRIRTSKDLKFTFFPTDEKSLTRNLKLWEYVNGNANALNQENHKYFIVMFPKWLYLFLRYSTQENVMNSWVAALTGLYAGEPEQRKKMEDRLERSLWLKVKSNFEEHFKEFEDFTFILANDWDLADEINDHYFEKRKRFTTRFDYFFRDQCGNPLILPFIYPIYDPRFGQKSLFNRSVFDIPLVNSYFTKSDWKRIIISGSTDELIRIDSEEEPWVSWKQNFVKANRI